MLVPGDRGHVRAGLILRPIGPFILPSHWIGEPFIEGPCQVLVRPGDGRRQVIRGKASEPTIHPPGKFLDNLFLIPGAAAEHVLGLRQTATDLDFDGYMLSHATAVEPNFEVPVGFTPHAGTSLGGMLLRNLLYATRETNIFEMLAADARARVDRLERQHGKWQREYEVARAAFISSVSLNEPT